MSPPPTVSDLHTRTRIQWSLLEVLRQAGEADPGTDVTGHLRDLVDQIDGMELRFGDPMSGKPSLEDRVRDVEELLNVSQVAVGEVEVLSAKLQEVEAALVAFRGAAERIVVLEAKVESLELRLRQLDDPDRLRLRFAGFVDRPEYSGATVCESPGKEAAPGPDCRNDVPNIPGNIPVAPAAELPPEVAAAAQRLNALFRPRADLPTEQGGPLLEAQDAQELDAVGRDEVEVEPAADLPEALEERERQLEKALQVQLLDLEVELQAPAAHRRAPDGPKARTFRDHAPHRPLPDHPSRRDTPRKRPMTAPIDLGPKVVAPPGKAPPGPVVVQPSALDPDQHPSHAASPSSGPRIELGPVGGLMPKGGRRAQLLELLRSSDAGLTCAEVLELAGVAPSDKPGRHRIEVALSTMVRDGVLERLEGRRKAGAKGGNPSGARYRVR